MTTIRSAMVCTFAATAMSVILLAAVTIQPAPLPPELRTLPPAEAVERLHTLARKAYWDAKDVAAAVSQLQTAIAHAQSQADAAASSDPDLSTKLRGWAKTCAYDLASFTWPGWNDADRRVTPEQTGLGSDAAKLNLKLAVDLKRPPERLADAHWLAGAHALAAGNHDAALRHFGESRRIDPRTDQQHLADGYAAITLLTAHRDVPTATVQFDTAIKALRDAKTQDATSLADQLIAARAFFVK